MTQNNHKNETVNIKDFLAEYCNKRSKRFSIKDPFYNGFRQNLYSVAEVFEKDFNTEAYFLTVTFPQMGTLEEEWEYARRFIENFKSGLSRVYMVIGGVIAVEAHKNSTLKKKTGKKTKAGRPHFHMLLWFANQFLNPSMHKLRLCMGSAGTMSRITLTPEEVIGRLQQI